MKFTQTIEYTPSETQEIHTTLRHMTTKIAEVCETGIKSKERELRVEKNADVVRTGIKILTEAVDDIASDSSVLNTLIDIFTGSVMQQPPRRYPADHDFDFEDFSDDEELSSYPDETSPVVEVVIKSAETLINEDEDEFDSQSEENSFSEDDSQNDAAIASETD